MPYTNSQLIGKCLSTKGKCKIIAFDNQNYRPLYKLGEVEIDWVDTTHLGDVMQSNLKVDQLITGLKNSGSN